MTSLQPPPGARATSLPYCTVKGFQACLRILGQPGAPERVDARTLVASGLSRHAAYPVLGGLRFLRLVDEGGRVTANLAPFLGDDVEGRRAVVDAACGHLLDRLELPVEDREAVDRLLVEADACAPGVAAFCSTFLLWLAAEAGYPVALPRRRRGRPPAHLAALSSSARQVLLARVAGSGDLDPAFAPPEQCAADRPERRRAAGATAVPTPSA